MEVIEKTPITSYLNIYVKLIYTLEETNLVQFLIIIFTNIGNSACKININEASWSINP